MGRFQNEMEHQQIGGTNFGFSAAKISDGASEYTLVTVVVDVSGSTSRFIDVMEKCLKDIIGSCRLSPMADTLRLRVVRFDTQVSEVHGFKDLPDCNENDYIGVLTPGGATALYDATFASVKAMTQYGKQLVQQHFTVNAALFVITDGDDNASSSTRKMVADAITDARTGEAVESIMPVLIGVNVDPTSGLNQYLDDFKNEGGFQQYVAVDKMDAKAGARLAGFISKSISSQAQARNSGGPSKSLSF